MAGSVTVLGFAAAGAADRVMAAMGAVAGPTLLCVRQAGLAAFAQVAPRGGLLARARGATAALRGLRIVQARLEAACLLGAPFLPADPAHCLCAEAAVPGLLACAAADISAALAGPARHHQWDVVLRWAPEAVVAAHRAGIQLATAAAGGGSAALAEAVAAALAQERDRRAHALSAVLGPVALGMAPAGAGPAEVGLTVLLPAGGDAALEAALQLLPADMQADCSADVRGPLPPLSFACIRIDSTAPAAVAAAWRLLALPATVDAASLRMHWRATASRLHPDRDGGAAADMQMAGDAFRLLRDLVPPHTAGGEGPAWSQAALQRHATWRARLHVAEHTVPQAAPQLSAQAPVGAALAA